MNNTVSILTAKKHKIRFNYIIEPQQDRLSTTPWVIIKLLLLRIIFHSNTIVLVGKTFPFTPDEANVDDKSSCSTNNLFCLLRILTLCHIQRSVSCRCRIGAENNFPF